MDKVQTAEQNAFLHFFWDTKKKNHVVLLAVKTKPRNRIKQFPTKSLSCQLSVYRITHNSRTLQCYVRFLNGQL